MTRLLPESRRTLEPDGRRRAAPSFARPFVGYAASVLAWPWLLGVGCGPPAAPSVRERPLISIVREAPGQARIEGVGTIRGFAQGRDHTFIHCLELVLAGAGRDVAYDELMGLSGLAFRLQFRVDRWDVGNPDPFVGESCAGPLFAAIGWDYEVRAVRRDELAEANALREAIRQSLDDGVPVLAANLIPPEDWGIITGYRPDRTWLCRAYHGGAEAEDRPATGWPTAVVMLTNRRQPMPPRAARDTSLRRAVELFDLQRSGSHAVGEKAFDNWCISLSTVHDHRYVHANFWTYVSLIDARAAAVRYLRGIAPGFGPKAMHLSAAAEWYDKEVRLLLQGLAHVPSERRFPNTMPPVEMRNRQIEILREAQKMERAAIEALRKAI